VQRFLVAGAYTQAAFLTTGAADGLERPTEAMIATMSPFSLGLRIN
jgi:hypothetical protein